MAYGHKDITHEVTQGDIENPGGDIILSAKEARDRGLVWSRRPGATKRLGVTPFEKREESEREAMAKGKEVRERMRKRLDDLEEVPDKLIPQDLRPGARRKPGPQSSSILTKRSRLRIDSDEDTSSIAKNRSRFQIDSNDESPLERPQNEEEQNEDSIQNSSSIQTSIPHTIPKSIEIYSGPKPGASMKLSVVKTFFLDEAEESKNDDEDDAWPHRSRSSSPFSSHLESSDEASEGEADSTDSFMVGDDIFD